MPAWRLLQLADSAFPAGGFACSGGLEAAMQLGEVRGEDAVAAFAAEALWQAGTFALPFVRAAHAEPAAAGNLDHRCEQAQASHVARRASRAQGRAWLRACAGAFTTPLPSLPLGHLPVAVGASTRVLDIGAADAEALYLHLTARGVLSAAVRLGGVGPLAAQRLQDWLGQLAGQVIAACSERSVNQAATSAPLQELIGALHDALTARLFQS